jgi:hypothetical protein
MQITKGEKKLVDEGEFVGRGRNGCSGMFIDEQIPVGKRINGVQRGKMRR